MRPTWTVSYAGATRLFTAGFGLGVFALAVPMAREAATDPFLLACWLGFGVAFLVAAWRQGVSVVVGEGWLERRFWGRRCRVHLDEVTGVEQRGGLFSAAVLVTPDARLAIDTTSTFRPLLEWVEDELPAELTRPSLPFTRPKPRSLVWGGLIFAGFCAVALCSGLYTGDAEMLTAGIIGGATAPLMMLDGIGSLRFTERAVIDRRASRSRVYPLEELRDVRLLRDAAQPWEPGDAWMVLEFQDGAELQVSSELVPFPRRLAEVLQDVSGR